MHSYLRAIGFGALSNKKQFRELLLLVIDNPDQMQVVQTDIESNIAVLTKEVAPGIGLALCGEMDEENHFQMEYHFPYLKGDVLSSQEICTLKKQSDKESYAGVCDDYRIGLTLIFYLTNFMEMKHSYAATGYWLQSTGVRLAALSCEGKVLLPIQKTSSQMEMAKKENQKRNALIEAAKSGNLQAIESLTIDDMNMFAKLSYQSRRQDIYSLIDTFMMPNGVECDQYSIMADIESVQTFTNGFTGEKFYDMQLLCNDIPLRLAIHSEDLQGVPMAGRRFKGQIWLQGEVS